jgi:predicted nucleotidyltransferase component of viral defense system
MKDSISIHARLLNIAKKGNLSFQLVIIRYLQERLLYRISLSRYAGNFCLKGGVLLYFYSKEMTRPTKDIDFLGTNIPNDKSFLVAAFKEICTMHYQNDAVNFISDTIVAEEIADRDQYPGVRLFVIAELNTIKQRLQIDVGFGDVVVPKPVLLSYPTLLSESEIPLVQAYSLETFIAEKFEAMIDLSTINSRMKDFYDVYCILSTQQLDKKNLKQAILETFRNRNTSYTMDHAIFSPEFAKDRNRLQLWNSFLRKNHIDQNLEFGEVLNLIIKTLAEVKI